MRNRAAEAGLDHPEGLGHSRVSHDRLLDLRVSHCAAYGGRVYPASRLETYLEASGTVLE
eukprot:scaffold38787_cov48-Phaeocystis_antarctica.AAC.1